MNDLEASMTLQKEWEDERCPLINGVIFRDGHVRRLEIKRSNEGAVNLEDLGVIRLADFLRIDPERVSTLTELCYQDLADRRLRISAGGGSFGGDGFIGVSELDTNEIKWIIFFDNANEFLKVGVRGQIIEAENSLSEVWRVSVNNPETIEIRHR